MLGLEGQAGKGVPAAELGDVAAEVQLVGGFCGEGEQNVLHLGVLFIDYFREYNHSDVWDKNYYDLI